MKGFIADTMLGTLAKWLRVLGFDTLYEAGMVDDKILQLANEQQRIILSRDRALCTRKQDSIFIETTDLDQQIVQVIQSYPANMDLLLSRCLECNSLLEVIAREDVSPEALPDGLWERYEEYWLCERCNAYYWRGSHFDKMRLKAGQLLEKSIEKI